MIFILNILAMITARGGSKRIPRKNIKDFCGKPVISYAIQTAVESGTFEEVMVSTDCSQIAQVAQTFGATVPFMRSQETSNDLATTADAILEVLQEYAKIGYKPKYACCIYPVTPLIQPEYYQQAYQNIVNNNFDVIITACRYSTPVERAMVSDGKRIHPLHKCDINKPSASFAPKFFDAGQFYMFNVETLLQTKSLFTENTGYIELPESKCQDVDTQEDWKMLELKYNYNNQ